MLLSWPVARISPQTAARITPGMTVERQTSIVGAEPGWYDGVTGISTNEQPHMGAWHEWTGARGRLILEPDARGRVKRATFYAALSVEQSLWQLLVERLSPSTETQWQRWWIYGQSY